ncbi:hypothetical protein Mmc1_1344 [Magnetococcus marinus MC-1]|uniref:Uncharacterized protein n=1 Tax=Magnetococcus marinus (strain ATCC BAA-1437 / JCM 17883 / MC-1) TaxID=156889 RepID=A0L7B2_MAGMM|nr:hypothetical protein [Magnetococcus marinus]ABK43855.1 hypothetical protein Mmc1_1344 [Magnetococcus marinus MC-1]
MPLSAAIQCPWSILQESALGAPYSLTLDRTLSTSWSIQVSHGVGGWSPILLSRQLEAAFDYLPPSFALNTQLPIALTADLNRARRFTLHYELTLALSSRFSARVQDARASFTLPIESTTRLQADAYGMRCSAALDFSLTARAENGSRDISVTGEIPLSLSGTITAARHTVRASGVITVESPAILFTAQSSILQATPALPIQLQGHISFAPRSRQVITPYAIHFPVARHLAAGYRCGAFIEQRLEAPWGIHVTGSCRTPWALGEFVWPHSLTASWKIQVGRGVEARYGAPVERALSAPYQDALLKTLQAGYALMGPVQQSLTCQWSATQPVHASLTTGYQLQARDSAHRAMTAWWDLLVDQPHVQATSGVRAIHFGLPL